MDRSQAEAYAVHMLEFIREKWPALEVSSLEVGRNDKEDVLWCKVHRTDDAVTHGGGYLFTVAYLDRIIADSSTNFRHKLHRGDQKRLNERRAPGA